jgi:hypothetical protein
VRPAARSALACVGLLHGAAAQHIQGSIDSAPARLLRRAVLPFRYLSTERAGAATLYIRPVAEIEPLTYQGSAREFRGALHLGLEDSLDPARSHTLSAPIEFLVSADRARATPANLSIQHTNLPFALVQLAAEAPDDSLRVHIRSAFNPQGVDMLVAVERPAITLEPVTQRRGRIRARRGDRARDVAA